MEYDKIILELLDRIKKLEAEVEQLKGGSRSEIEPDPSAKKIKLSKKYRRLTEALKNSNSASVMYEFSEIEKIIGFSLPDSAYVHRAFWANTDTHSIAHGWLAAGYKVADVNLTEEKVVFERGFCND